MTVSSFDSDNKTREYWLVYGGSTWAIDSFGLFVMPPVIITGMCLNLASFLILHFGKVFKRSEIYVYLKFSFLIGFVCNSSSVLYPFAQVRRFLDFANSFAALFYMNSFAQPIANFSYFYTNVLDIFIVCEKLSIFSKDFANLVKRMFASSHTVCIVSLLVCFMVDMPYFFFYYVSKTTVQLSSNESYLFYNYEMTAFFRSDFGTFMYYFQYVVRDIVPFLILLALNITLCVELRKYLHKKTLMTGKAVVRARGSRKESDSHANKANLSVMVICICFLSIIKTCIVLVSIIDSSFEDGFSPDFITTLSCYFINTNMLLNTLIVFCFDKNFKKFAKKCVICNNAVGVETGIDSATYNGQRTMSA